METRQSQVCGHRQAVVLSGNDVIDLKGGWVQGLWHEAIFASASRTAPHQFDERLIHDRFPRMLLPCRLLESSARLGVKNAEQTAGMGVAAKLLSFSGGESALLVSVRKVFDPSLLFLAEAEAKQVPSEGRCEVLAVAEDSSQDRNFAGGGCAGSGLG
jgi:hypothetical protein